MTTQFATEMNQTVKALYGQNVWIEETEDLNYWVCSTTWETMTELVKTCNQIYGMVAVDVSVRKDIYYSTKMILQ